MKNVIIQKIIFALLSIVVISSNVFSQDVRFTQALSNPLNLNPAMMGLNSDIKFALQYRNQWGSVSSGFSTYSFTTLLPIYLNKDGANKLDLGFNATNDVSGAYNKLNLSLAFGYNLRVSEASYINVSFLGGMVQQSLNTANLALPEQYVSGSYNSSNPNNETTLAKKTSYADLSAGAIWYCAPVKLTLANEHTIKAYFGASAFHLNKPTESSTGVNAYLPVRYSVQGGAKIVGEKIDVSPNVYTNVQGGNAYFASGFIFDYKIDASKLTLGVWYISRDAIAFCAGYSHSNFSLMYSYDVMATSPIGTASTSLGTHEVTLMVYFNRAQKKDIKFTPSF